MSYLPKMVSYSKVYYCVGCKQTITDTIATLPLDEWRTFVSDVTILPDRFYHQCDINVRGFVKYEGVTIEIQIQNLAAEFIDVKSSLGDMPM